jgi:hypothetical protein
MDTKEIAKLIRKDLKAMGGFKFSVTMERFAGGSSINVAVMESPARLIRTIDEIPEHTNTNHYTRVQIAEMQLKNYHQLNHHFAYEEYSDESWNNGVFMTKAGHGAVKQINEIIQKYHWDKSEPMTDYFHTNFYYHIGLGKWDKDFIDGQ